MVTKAFSLADSACARGDHRACRAAYRTIDTTRINPKATEEQREALSEAARRAEAAFYNDWRDRDVFDHDTETELEPFVARCERGEVEVCGAIAGGIKDHDKQQSYYDRACLGGVSFRCKGDAKKAACADGDAGACDQPRKWRNGSEEELETACNAGTAWACADLAWNKEPNAEKALGEYIRGCPPIRSRADWLDIDVASCAKAAEYYRQGKGVAKSALIAASFYQDACLYSSNVEEPSGCEELAQMYEHGEGLEVNLPFAIDLYAKACSDGSACDDLDRLLGRPDGASFKKGKASRSRW
jgi:TPR repeat protein